MAVLLFVVLTVVGCVLVYRKMRPADRESHAPVSPVQTVTLNRLTPVDALGRLMLTVGPLVMRHGYQVASQTEAGVVFSRTRPADGSVFLAVVLFPIGLLFLLSKQTDTLTLTLTALDGGTRVTCAGLRGREARPIATALHHLEAAESPKPRPGGVDLAA